MSSTLGAIISPKFKANGTMDNGKLKFHKRPPPSPQASDSKGWWSPFASRGSREMQDRDPGAPQPPGQSHPSTKLQIRCGEERLAQHRTVQSGSPLWPPRGCLAELGNPCIWGAVGPEVSSSLTKRTDLLLLAPRSRHADPAPRSGLASGMPGSVGANPSAAVSSAFLFPACSRLTVSPTSLTSQRPSGAPKPSPAKMNGRTNAEGRRKEEKQTEIQNK